MTSNLILDSDQPSPSFSASQAVLLEKATMTTGNVTGRPEEY
jgi:hypothetical protein